MKLQILNYYLIIDNYQRLISCRHLGTSKNEAEGLRWYKKSANQGFARAQYNVGNDYYFEKGNKIKAYEYWYKASKQGFKSATKNIGILCKQDPWACK